MPATRRRQRGFTMIELSISLVVMTLIGGALVSITWAVADGWQASDNLQSIQATGRQISARLYNTIRAAKIIGLASADGVYVFQNGTTTSAAVGGSCMMWRDDTNGDGKIQWGEVTLLQRDPASNTLFIFSMPPTAAKANSGANLTDIQSSKDADDFKKLAGVVSQAFAHDVTAASFKAYDVGTFAQPKIVEFMLTFTRDGQVRSEYGTPELRSPLAGTN